MVVAVTKHIKSLNWGYKTDLSKNKVKYYNHFATFVDPHTIELDNNKTKIRVTSERFVIACGSRPSYPDLPNAKELAITSDDLFALKTPPGKTCIVGGSYIALECSGFLNSLGYETTVIARSILLRGFDRSCAEKIGSHMSATGTRIIY